MLARLHSYALAGLEAYPVTIEVDVSAGLPSTTVVGLPDNAVKESKERVRSAIKNSGFAFPAQRITINLAPADMKKEGPSFELAMALGLLACGDSTHTFSFKKYAILGELALDGQVRPVKGALSIAMAVSPGRFEGLIVPEANAAEASMANAAPIYPVKSLADAVNFLLSPEAFKPFEANPSFFFQESNRFDADFAEVKGQFHVKRGLEIAAAGGHNILLIGPPGSGKTMLAKRLPTILPDLTLKEAIETTRIHSLANLINPQIGMVTARPFRSPHHTTSDIAIVGGGTNPRPGEISLAHNGVLFLDELPEFNRNVLEVLRQPLEDHYVVVSRAARAVKFPSQFMLIGAMNPCPCGMLGQLKNPCRCNSIQIHKYRSKISGPLLDRIDIHLDVPAVPYQDLINTRPAESSVQIRERVNKARAIQIERFTGEKTICNASMSHKQVRKFCALGKEENDLLKMAMTELNLSARAYDKVLKVSRTIADLEGSEQIKTEHLAEAIQYRSLDREFFNE